MPFWNLSIDELINYIRNSLPFNRIKVSGDATVSGNVGIGVAATLGKLELINASAPNDTVNSLVWFRSGADVTLGPLNLIFKFYPSATAGSRYIALEASDSSAYRNLILNPTGNGFVGICTTAPSYYLHLNTDSAGKPGVGGLWTVVSDERIKKDIGPADLDRCCEIVKSVPLKHFGWADGVYTEDQVKDRNCLGWVSQDVQKVFPKSTNPIQFIKKFPDGTEDYEEEIAGSDGIKKKVMKTRDKFREEKIEDCLDLNAGQMIMALYGAVQKLIERIEILEKNGGKS